MFKHAKILYHFWEEFMGIYQYHLLAIRVTALSRLAQETPDFTSITRILQQEVRCGL